MKALLSVIVGFSIGIACLETLAQTDSSSDPGVTVVSDQSEAMRLQDVLQEQLTDVAPGDKIQKCDLIVRSNQYAGQDEIFGGSCLVSVGKPKPARLLMCASMMVRKFTMSEGWWFAVPPVEDMGKFIRFNCPVGG